MKVTCQRQYPNSDRGGYFIVTINGKQRLGIGGGEPEDMSLGRDLSDVLDVPAMLTEAYLAGKRGEDFEMVELPDLEDEL